MKIRKPGLLVLAAAVLTLPVSITTAEESAGAAGHWAGEITLPAEQLPIRVDLVQGADGWSAEMDVTTQGIRNLVLADVSVEGTTITFRMPGVPGEPTFDGELSEDGAAIVGTMNQAGQTFEFRLDRSEPAEDDGDANYADFEKAGVPGEGLVGLWRGLIVSGPARLRLVVTFTEEEDGSLDATMDSLDQGANDLPVDGIEVGDDGSVIFQITMVGGRYRGTLNEDGSEIAGEWFQGGGTVALNLRRGTE
jgi:hypothetical protein